MCLTGPSLPRHASDSHPLVFPADWQIKKDHQFRMDKYPVVQKVRPGSEQSGTGKKSLDTHFSQDKAGQKRRNVTWKDEDVSNYLII